MKPLLSEQEVEQAQGVFHMTCTSIKAGNIRSSMPMLLLHTSSSGDDALQATGGHGASDPHTLNVTVMLPAIISLL